jgi:uncharacterized protein (TIGR00251 family)
MKILVIVTPNSRVEEVTREADRFLVKVKEPPREGKANQSVIRLLASHFRVSQNYVRVLKGQTSKIKIVEIQGK